VCRLKCVKIKALTRARLLPGRKCLAAKAKRVSLAHGREQLGFYSVGLRFKLADNCLKDAVVFILCVLGFIGLSNILRICLGKDKPHIVKSFWRRWHTCNDMLIPKGFGLGEHCLPPPTGCAQKRGLIYIQESL